MFGHVTLINDNLSTCSAHQVANLTTEELSMQDFTLECVFALGLLNGDVWGLRTTLVPEPITRQAKCVPRFSHEPHFVAVDLDFSFQNVGGSKKIRNKQVCRSVVEFLRLPTR